jgi:hypothetical protein
MEGAEGGDDAEGKAEAGEESGKKRKVCLPILAPPFADSEEWNDFHQRPASKAAAKPPSKKAKSTPRAKKSKEIVEDEDDADE